MYRIEYTTHARRAFKKLDRVTATSLRDVIRRLAENPRPHNCIKLTGRPQWRIREGRYRVIYEIDDGVLLVLITDVQFRREDTYD